MGGAGGVEWRVRREGEREAAGAGHLNLVDGEEGAEEVCGVRRARGARAAVGGTSTTARELIKFAQVFFFWALWAP